MRLKNSINENFYTIIEIRYPIIENYTAMYMKTTPKMAPLILRYEQHRKSKNAGCLNKAVRIISIKGFI